ncbi:FecR family protein [Pedobacter sp. L105]|uniref:FecR family protein n=1 Tax=Pedobacter sp. L105 TaxID=1641871 RepID=UPI00131E22DB|nr:FecR family protein [Pedobacter sp. L105]
MKKETLRRLLREYLDNTINSADGNDLLNYLNNASTDEVTDLIEEGLLRLDEGPVFKGKQSDDVLIRIKSDPRFTKTAAVPEPEIIKFYQKSWLQIAAAILIVSTLGLFAVRHSRPTKIPAQLAANPSSVIVPGSKKATLVMGNGRVILLEDAGNGVLAKAGGSSVVKTRSGEIVYHGKNTLQAADNKENYNTLTTPKGGEYQVVLPDGTKVWLNAASSISYPVAFTGNERHVKLTGEAYFEVTKDKHKPFYVDINSVEVKVVGTHFNISGYSDEEQITTTLLEGSVQVTKNKSQLFIIPGQQAVVNYSSDHIAVSAANIDDVMAWKNGYFTFNDENIRNIMKKVSRWYDVDIDYQGTITDQNFGGTYFRSKSIVELLHHLERVGKVHFKIIGRRITVME